MTDQTPDVDPHDVPPMNLDPKALTHLVERAKREDREITTDDLVEDLGVQSTMALGANLTPEAQLREDFAHWYAEVMEPLGMERDATWRLYTGAISIEEFVAGVSPDLVENFVARYPDLQARYMATHGDVEGTGE